MLRDELRGLPALVGRPPVFDTGAIPADPLALFVDWLREAVDAGVPEAHAMTLSTVEGDGLPDARVLLLKDLTAEGWWFASEEGSAKGRQLAENPRVRGASVRRPGLAAWCVHAASVEFWQAHPNAGTFACATNASARPGRPLDCGPDGCGTDSHGRQPHENVRPRRPAMRWRCGVSVLVGVAP